MWTRTSWALLAALISCWCPYTFTARAQSLESGSFDGGAQTPSSDHAATPEPDGGVEVLVQPEHDGGADTLALAQPDPGGAVLDVPAAPTDVPATPPQQTAPIHVTARGEPVDRTPRSASEVIRSGAILRAAPHKTAADMLKLAPGLFVSQHGGEGDAYQIFYRGFDAVHGQDLEIWVGGAPVNDTSNIHGQGYADLNFVMPEVVQRMRVLPGTYDPRQGDFAVAGTVRFDLGYDQEGITAKAGYGSFGAQRYFLAYRPKGASADNFAAAEVYSTDGFGPSRAARRASATAQSKLKLNDETTLRVLLMGYAGHFDSAGVLRLQDIQSGTVSRFATYDPNQGGAGTRVQLVVGLEYQDDDVAFGVTPYVVLRTMQLRQNFTGHLQSADGDLQQQLNDDLVVGGTAYYRRHQRIFSPRDIIEAGISLRSDWIDQSQKMLANTDRTVTKDLVDARVRSSDIAGYLDLALHPLSRLTVHGGIRIDGLYYASQDNGGMAQGQARSSQGAHFGKKISTELRIVRGLAALASYGEGFRSPQVRRLAWSESTPFTRVRSFEGGLRYGSSLISASAAGFRTWLSDDLVFDQTTTRNEAVPATTRTGGTADVTIRPAGWVVLNLNGTYTKAEFRYDKGGYAAGDLVPYSPQLVSRADFSLTPLLGEWFGRELRGQFGGAVSYITRRALPYSQFGHKILLVDAQLGLRFGEGALNLRCLNVLDADWYDGEFMFASKWDSMQAASLVPERHVSVGSPRTFFLSLELYL